MKMNYVIVLQAQKIEQKDGSHPAKKHEVKDPDGERENG